MSFWREISCHCRCQTMRNSASTTGIAQPSGSIVASGSHNSHRGPKIQMPVRFPRFASDPTEGGLAPINPHPHTWMSSSSTLLARRVPLSTLPLLSSLVPVHVVLEVVPLTLAAHWFVWHAGCSEHFEEAL